MHSSNVTDWPTTRAVSSCGLWNRIFFAKCWTTYLHNWLEQCFTAVLLFPWFLRDEMANWECDSNKLIIGKQYDGTNWWVSIKSVEEMNLPSYIRIIYECLFVCSHQRYLAPRISFHFVWLASFSEIPSAPDFSEVSSSKEFQQLLTQASFCFFSAEETVEWSYGLAFNV